MYICSNSPILNLMLPLLLSWDSVFSVGHFPELRTQRSPKFLYPSNWVMTLFLRWVLTFTPALGKEMRDGFACPEDSLKGKSKDNLHPLLWIGDWLPPTCLPLSSQNIRGVPHWPRSATSIVISISLISLKGQWYCRSWPLGSMQSTEKANSRQYGGGKQIEAGSVI